MTDLSDQLRKEIDDAIRQVYKAWKANGIQNASPENVTGAAEYAVSDYGILAILSETGLPGEPATAWQKVAHKRRQSVLLLRCVEHVLEKWES